MITFKAKDKSGEIFNSALSTHTFPAGEANIKKEPQRELEETEIAVVQFTPSSMHNDLFHLAMWSDFIKQTSPTTRQVAVIPYFPGARADRGAPFGAGIYSMFLYATTIDEVIIFDPHSDVIVEQLNCDPEYFKVSVLNSHETLPADLVSEYDGIIAPDKGAIWRADAVAQVSSLPFYHVDKVRDFETGKLLSFDASSIPKEGKFLIVDDICDGGGTFLGIAEATGLPPEQLDLYVSHGVFSGKALKNLPEKFGKVITTNSFNPTLQLNGELLEQAWRCDPHEFKDIKYKADNTFKRIDVIRPMLDKITV